jgi:tetratricopeptide (TPR) repeat protein
VRKTAADYVKKALELRDAGRNAEAIIAARRATTMDETDANAWWQLALSLVEEKGEEEACAFFEKTVDLSSTFSYGWHRLGVCYSRLDRQDDAIDCWEHALDLSIERYDSIRQLLYAYGQRKQNGDEDKRFELLKNLERSGELRDEEFNSLGIGYYNRKDYLKAIICWKDYALNCNAPVAYFNMGLAYSQREVGQLLDAIDIWRMAIDFDPSYKSPISEIDRVLPHLIKIRNKACAEDKALIEPQQWYENYINPIQLLALDDVDDPCSFDTKSIQKAKKILLQEIELEDGRVEWMPNLHIDRSRAISVTEEIDHGEYRKYHSIVFENKPLLAFLSTGSIELFTVDEDESPVSFLEELIFNTSFANWLSKYFAPQYSLILTSAIESKCIAEVECILSGRRWAIPSDEDKCFESAHRSIGRLLDPLRKYRELARKEKPSMADIKNILSQHRLSELISKLPLAFQEEKGEAASLMRGISIDSYNTHDDADLAISILNLSLPFVEGVPSLNHQFKEDKEALEDRVRELHKDEVFLTVAGAPHNITSSGVKFGNIEINNQSIESIRWGVLISQERGLKKHIFSMAINGSGSKNAKVEWYAIDNIEEQEKLFNKLVDAVFSYITPTVMDKVRHAIYSGETLSIGSVKISKDGAIFTLDGWFGSKLHLCPWSRVRADLSNGDLVLSDPSNSKAKASMPLRETDNAFVLYMMAK